MKQRFPIVASTVAIVVAVLGWTPLGEAARNLVIPSRSVGTAQLKTGAVTTPKLKRGAVATTKLKNGAVTSLKVLDNSLLVQDFRAGQLPAGPKGDKGDPGAIGPPGVSGWQRVTNESSSDSNPSKTVIASCPAGKRIVGGGALILSALVLGPALTRSGPNGDTEWLAQGREIVATNDNWRVVVQAICATVSS